MLLRRIAQHVKSQNWFAVALDFVIVVFGVFIGIQLGNWNEARANQARSHQYMERIVVDLTQEISVYDDRLQFWRLVSDNGLTVLDEARAAGKSLDTWDLLLAYFQASQVAEFYPTNSTFEELKSAGELDLNITPIPVMKACANARLTGSMFAVSYPCGYRFTSGQTAMRQMAACRC